MSQAAQSRLRECLVQLHLPGFRDNYSSHAALATQDSLSYPRYLLGLCEIEVAERNERRQQRLRRASKLPR